MESDTGHIHTLIAEKLPELGFELFDLKTVPAGPKKLIRIYIDSPHGVTIDDCERVSRELSLFLDVENVFNQRPYTLEVSSPGIDRPLKTPKDYARNTGRRVRLSLHEIVENKKSVRGIIRAATDAGVRILLNDKEIEIPFSQVQSAKIELEFK
ncbi:MAG: ribosome maturation factor RimP [Chitinivibrionales bacterium]|nr:ribosome maturation factor RimP [Chitinivibrionales bacterium]